MDYEAKISLTKRMHFKEFGFGKPHKEEKIKRLIKNRLKKKYGTGFSIEVSNIRRC